MSEQIGKMLTCDRCGASVFLKYTGSKEFDGGFTTAAFFEDVPVGWESESIAGRKWALLCPKCHEQLKTVTDNFFRMVDKRRD